MLFRLGKFSVLANPHLILEILEERFWIGKWMVKCWIFIFRRMSFSSHHNLVKDQMQISFMDKILPDFEALV